MPYVSASSHSDLSCHNAHVSMVALFAYSTYLAFVKVLLAIPHKAMIRGNTLQFHLEFDL